MDDELKPSCAYHKIDTFVVGKDEWDQARTQGGFEVVRLNPLFCSLKLILSLNTKFAVHHAIHTRQQ